MSARSHTRSAQRQKIHVAKLRVAARKKRERTARKQTRHRMKERDQ